MPTRAASATSRIVGFCGTASIEIELLIAFAFLPSIRAGNVPERCYSRASLAHHGHNAKNSAPSHLMRALSKESKNRFHQVVSQHCRLTGTFYWVSVLELVPCFWPFECSPERFP